jgi:rod shape-determining protein MreC
MTYSLASNRAPVRKGDVLLTTGSDTYAAGIPIGTVTAVAPDANAISRSATVVPFVDVASLDVVGVIVDGPRAKPRGLLRPIGPGASPTSSPCPPAVPQGPVPTSTPTPTPVLTPRTTATPTTTPRTTPSRTP